MGVPEKLFKKLDEFCKGAGKELVIYIFGANALILQRLISRRSLDVDFFTKTNQRWVLEAIQEMKR
ncbi:MAG TPA: hypothetical protein VFE88_00140 [Candidatus Nanoarchaeia archaeon]|nr:hypothetical protein [Candidatus Nanoarchaeia archaeon]